MLLSTSPVGPKKQRSIDSFFTSRASPQKTKIVEAPEVPSSPDVTVASSPIVVPPVVPAVESPVITIEDFELDYSTESQSDTQSDTSSEFMETAGAAEPPSETKTELIHTRHSELTRELSKPILTPSWHAMEDASASAKVADFDLVEMHHQLEVLEHRIQVGKDEIHEHPAMSIEVLRSEGVQAFSRKDLARRANYTSIEERALVPTFWERRVYDRQEDLLTQDDSDRLAETISRHFDQDYRSSVVTRRRSWHPTPEKKHEEPLMTISSEDESLPEEVVAAPQTTPIVTRSQQQTLPEQLKKMTLKLSTKYFSTDDSGEETDFEM